ncbi:uncharacterized protein BDR25DRAFT_56849 [Lindgomyces ingoldianus]|uniref:Uncharacterized protein n=1 Tax=Lindgomyces ingoldianus TaxID=673940 RepID=A0ACB6QMZ2_9PLEO|nr:uncharacterized protein BDR25DRAFT_56849 [Lindgomyces ingoldianus]KAF2468394.1 hypothetical protein BDR25DRAFT_56849 [Lindgomyces ingoldianus]
MGPIFLRRYFGLLHSAVKRQPIQSLKHTSPPRTQFSRPVPCKYCKPQPFSRFARYHDGKWFCSCNLPAIWKQVKKRGHFEGMTFLRCPKEMGKQCDFILWKDHESGARGLFK